MGKRKRVKHSSGKYMYLERGRKGRFKNWTNINRSIQADMRKVGKKVKPGYGHKGDLLKDGPV